MTESKVFGFFTKDRKVRPITAPVQSTIIIRPSRLLSPLETAEPTKVIQVAWEEYDTLKPLASRIDVAGSIRRREPKPADIDIVIIPKSAKAKEAIYEHASQYKIRAKGEQLLSYWKKGVQIDIYFAEPEYYGSMLMFTTGPGTYNIALRRLAGSQGLKLNQYGVWKGNRCIGSRTEADVYEALGHKFKSPELRGLSEREARTRYGIKPGQRIIRMTI